MPAMGLPQKQRRMSSGPERPHERDTFMTQQTGRDYAACARPAASRAVARGAVAAALAVASLAAGAMTTAASADASTSARAAATGGTLRAWGNNVTGQL